MVIAWGSSLGGAVYHVATTGDDANPGTEQAPWRTIQRAATLAQPGDLVLVQEGTYPERVTTVRGGTHAADRIVFRASGRVEMRGWVVRHPYISIEGFDITQHSAASTLDAYIRVENGANYFELRGSNVRDGIELVDQAVVFDSSSNAVRVSKGGFVDAGFRPGTCVAFFPAARPLSLRNNGVYLVTDVTGDTLWVRESLLEDGPRRSTSREAIASPCSLKVTSLVRSYRGIASAASLMMSRWWVVRITSSRPMSSKSAAVVTRCTSEAGATSSDATTFGRDHSGFSKYLRMQWRTTHRCRMRRSFSKRIW
ncbi:DUF1565 domain-containing protein [Limisphaera sp. VF-2]|uniref:DUF1565 domain-containing protein n=1 Tax=Limisphaera sp. VF-2 TaxID=3400418 RepID=UPI001765ACB7